jgi:hypothetical protein
MVTETDFFRIAEELRRASQEAKTAAELNPEQSAQLRAKALKLLLAADRIQADARGREGFIVVNHGRAAAGAL